MRDQEAAHGQNGITSRLAFDQGSSVGRRDFIIYVKRSRVVMQTAL
jgi:hypothetical protein